MEIELQKDENEVHDKLDENTEFFDDNGQEFEDFNEFRPNFGRGGILFRGGRGGNHFQQQPRFRGGGRGGSGNFGGNPFGQMRGRGGPPPFFRGGRGGGPAGRFQGPGNFDQNWGPPPGHFSQGGGGPMMQELWVETKTEEGKSYFYHAVSRETTWTRPEGPHVKIMTQSEVEAMNKQQQQQNAEKTAAEQKSLAEAQQNGTNGDQAKPIEGQSPYSGPPPQFGMPPPNYNYPPNQWQPPAVEPPKPITVAPSKPGEIDITIITKAAEWSEHRAPDGRPYYYQASTGESVWEKPQALRDLESARMAAFTNAPPPTPSLPVATPQITAPIITPIMSQIHHVQPIPGANAVMFDPMGFVMKPVEEESIEVKLEKKRKLDLEKKKKEEEEEKAKQAAKLQDKSRPISSTPISGTPWCVVWTGDGRVFFYNPSTRTSLWERPEELLERADVDKAVGTPPEQLLPNQDSKEDGEEDGKTLHKRKDMSGGGQKRSESESSTESEEVSIKKLKTEIPPVIKPVEKKVDEGKEAAIEAEVRAARERALVPLEIRVKSFKEMLKEKDVSAFSTWEKELHKIVFDPRYLLLTSRERKQVFEKYVKERAEEERREKRNKMRQKRDDFRSLLEYANLHGKSSFSEFAQKYGKDERFRIIEKIRERESLFNEFIVEIRKKEKDDKIHKKEQIKKDYISMLREHSEIDRHSRWPDVKKKIEMDSRYRAVDGSILREDYFHDFCKILKDEKKRAKEKDRERKDKKKEKERERDRSRDKGEKEKSKDKSHDDSKEKEESKEKDENMEDGEHPLTSEDEAERQQKERDRQMRAELSIKEREKEVQRTLATHMRDRDKEREHHKRDEAMRHFNALLADLVRNSDLSWKEAKKQLRKDHRWELVETLDRDNRERLFNDHIESLSKKKRDKFREMLEELPKMELTSSWKDVKKVVKEDPRYLKFNSSDRCEREFREYIKDKTIEAKSALRELLLECKLITHKSFETSKENPNHLRDIEEILKNDKRYLVLDHLSYDRTQIIMTYVEDLNKRGPPPPPTASESTRRK